VPIDLTNEIVSESEQSSSNNRPKENAHFPLPLALLPLELFPLLLVLLPDPDPHEEFPPTAEDKADWKKLVVDPVLLIIFPFPVLVLAMIRASTVLYPFATWGFRGTIGQPFESSGL